MRDRLLALAERRGVTLLTNTIVTAFAPSPAGWTVEREGQGTTPLQADAVIVATGGLSVPNTGSDGGGLRVVEGLGHTIRPTYAALTPLTARPAPFETGISLPVTLTARAGDLKASARGGFLFTHNGYSGPSVLDVSHVAVRSRIEGASPARVTVRWTRLTGKDWERALRPRGSRTVLNAVAAELPNRLAEALVDFAGVEPRRVLSNLAREERLRLIETLTRGALPWTGDEGYKKAEVTGGGVDLSEIDPKTMESRKHNGLFLCGEMLDAFGPIGGYNFLWAWATGRAAGTGAAAYVTRFATNCSGS